MGRLVYTVLERERAQDAGGTGYLGGVPDPDEVHRLRDDVAGNAPVPFPARASRPTRWPPAYRERECL